jgi:hypothetical protein
VSDRLSLSAELAQATIRGHHTQEIETRGSRLLPDASRLGPLDIVEEQISLSNAER